MTRTLLIAALAAPFFAGFGLLIGFIAERL
jgi:uncharacterized membrane-anchored protein YitT (DUF2179 family)